MMQVSVLTPSWNYGRFISDALCSVSAQAEGLELEHIVADAGSTDDTVDILKSGPDRLRWWSRPDRGQSDALNRAFESSSGRWISWLNADEFYLPWALSALVAAGEDLGVDAVFGDSVFVDARGRFLRLLPQHRYEPRLLRTYGCYIASCSLVLRRAAIAAVGGWDSSLRRVMDWSLLLSLQEHGFTFAHMPVPVGVFRIHSDQVTASPRQEHRAEYVHLRVQHGVTAMSDEGRTTVSGSLGRLHHSALKLRDGAYRRQWEARGLKGSPFNWFADGAGMQSCHGLMQMAYPGTPT
jgi:hypothetical protein